MDSFPPSFYTPSTTTYTLFNSKNNLYLTDCQCNNENTMSCGGNGECECYPGYTGQYCELGKLDQTFDMHIFLML